MLAQRVTMFVPLDRGTAISVIDYYNNLAGKVINRDGGQGSRATPLSLSIRTDTANLTNKLGEWAIWNSCNM